MLSPLVALVARGVVRDAETNTISVFSIMERLTPVGFPLFIPEMAFLVMWTKAAGDPDQFGIEFVVNNNATQLMRGPFQVDFAGTPIHRSILRAQGMVVNEPGALRFSAFHNAAEIAHYEIVVAAPAPAVQHIDAP